MTILTPKTFLTYSLGCRTNQAEVETISLQFMTHGFVPFSPKKFPLLNPALPAGRSPALLLLNTCVVTQKAEKETRQKIRELRKKYPESFLIVLGCAVTAKDKFKINLPEADLLVPNEKKKDFVQIILKDFCHSERVERVEESLSPATGKRSLHFGRDDTLGNKYTLSGRKFIKIQDGCNQGCSFCITQFVRGKPTSASPEKVIKEINFWANRGIKEIILTGINIGLYGIDNENSPLSFRANKESRGIPSKQKRRDPPTEPALSKAEEVGMTITNLVNQILKQTKIERISFSSIYPEMLISMTGSNPVSKFTEIVVNNSRISQYFHLSLQSGSQTVLERMNRKTNLDQLLKKLQWIKSKNPLFTFRADIIAGFPNETEKEFQETLDFMVNARISSAHVFTYSPRKGTVAFEMIKSKKWQDLSESVKKERAEKIRTVVEKTRGKEAKRLITKVFNCLIVKRTPNGYEGITENGWPIRISIKKPSFAKATAGKQVLCIKGKILPVKITGYKKDQLLGEIVDLPTKGTKTSGIPTLPSGC